jgi:hypothetical protein
LAKQLTADEKRILEDFRSKQAQRTASRVTKSGIDPNERLRLAREQQQKTDRIRSEAKSEASRRIAEAQAKARQARTAQQERDRLAELDRKRIAEAQSRQQAQEFARQQQLALTQNTSLRPTKKQAELSKQVTRFLAERKQQEQQKQQKSEKKIERVKKSVFRKEPRESIGSVVRVVAKDLPKPTVRQLTDDQKRSPQFMGGAVKEFLTKERQPVISIIPSVPEASAEEFRPSQNVPRRENIIPLAPQTQTPSRSLQSGEQFRSVLLNPNVGQVVRELPDGTKEVQGAFTVLSGEAGSQQPERPPKSENFLEGFIAGGRQELVNFGNVADVVTGKEGTFGKSSKEVGSTIVDLPFAVGGAFLTKEVEQGKGFGGLGFEFDVNLDRALQKSGEEQEFIAKEFERDPARALGSTVTALGTEVALIVGTAGTATVARKGIVKTAQFVAKTKAHKQAVKIAKETIPKGEENVPFIVEQIGKNKFEVIRGVEALGKKGIKVIRGTDQGIVQSVGAKGELIVTKVPKIFGVGRKGKIRRGGSKQRLDPKETVQATSSNDSSIPLTIIDTSKSGKTTFFPKKIPKRSRLQTKDTTILEGVTGEEITASRNIGRQISTGLKPFEQKGERIAVTKTVQPDPKTVVGEFTNLKRSFTTEGVEIGSKNAEDTLRLIGKPTKATAKQLDELEDTGFIQTAARGFSFATDDVKQSGKIITDIVKTGKTTKQSLPKNVKEFKEARKFERVQPTEVRVQTFEIFSTKAESTTGKLKQLPKVGKEKDFVKAKPFEFGKTGTKVVSNTSKKSGKTTTKVRVEQDIGKIRQTFRDIAKTKPKTKSKPKATARSTTQATSLGARIGSAVLLGSEASVDQPQKSRTRNEFGTVVIPQTDTGLINEDRLITEFPPRIRPSQEVIPRQDIVPITRVDTVPILQTPTVSIFDTPTKKTTTSTPPVIIGGAPRFTEADIARREARSRRSGQGKRLFDVAKTPFGKVTVGLGFFIEQKGDETIAEAIGVPEPKEPKAKRKKDPDPLSAVFGEQSGQFDTTFQF